MNPSPIFLALLQVRHRLAFQLMLASSTVQGGEMLRAFVVAGFVIGSVSAASAADRYKAPYAPMPAPMPVSDWTAFYVGGFAGGSRVTEPTVPQQACALLM
jgi:hypothetical protein